jgi:capsular polysaccharide biosynthesis protein
LNDVTSKETRLRFIKNGWWLVLLAITTAVGAALVATTVATPIYEANTRYVISPSRAVASPNYGDMVDGVDALSRRSTVATYAEIFQSERAIDGALTALNLPLEAAEDYEVTAVVLPETSVIHLSVIGPDAAAVQALASQIGEEAVVYIRNLYEIYEVTLLDVAKTPQLPISPNLLRSTLVAAVLGLLVGLLLALARTPAVLGGQEPAVAQQPVVSAPVMPAAELNGQPAAPAPAAPPLTARERRAHPLNGRVPQGYELVDVQIPTEHAPYPTRKANNE